MKYLLIKGVDGLGNRLLAVASGLLYAEITGRRPIVDWSDPEFSGDGSNMFHRCLDAPSVGRLEEIPEGASLAPEHWRGRLGEPVRDERMRLTRPQARALYRRASIDLLRTDHPADLLVMWSTRDRVDYLRPHLPPEEARQPTDLIVRRTIEAHINPAREVADRIARFRAEHLSGPAVGVHVRYSDLRFRISAIRRRLDWLLARQPGLTVFLATDNVSVRDDFERSYGAVSTPHWYPEPGARLHRAQDRDREQVTVEALTDLYLLAGCDHLIGDRVSSFTRMAMTLSRGSTWNVQALRKRWHLPVKAVWRHAVPGPAGPVALAVARSLLR